MIDSMSWKGYAASIVFDAADKIIVGRVVDIDDIISLNGPDSMAAICRTR